MGVSEPLFNFAISKYIIKLQFNQPCSNYHVKKTQIKLGQVNVFNCGFIYVYTV